MKRLLSPDNLDLGLALLISIGTAALVLVLPDWQSPVRVVLGLVLVLVIPGYTLTTALFPQREGLDGIERLALTLGLSIAVVPLIGLILNYTPWGIRLSPIAVSLVIFIAFMVAVSSFRRARFAPADAFYLPFDSPAFRTNALVVLGAIAVMGGVIALASTLRPEEHFTEFYILGPNGKLEGYPSELAPGETFTLRLGVGNHEGEATSYLIEVPFEDDRLIETPEIEAGKSWERVFTFRAPQAEGETKLAFELHKDDLGAEPYRSLHLFVNVGSGGIKAANPRSQSNAAREEGTP